VVCSLINETRRRKNTNENEKSVYFTHIGRGETPVEPIAIKYGNSLYLTEEINRSKFGVDWYSSFGSGEV